MDKRYKKLLAKRPIDQSQVRYEETLVGHTERVCGMANTIAEMLAPRLSHAFEVNPDDCCYWKAAVIIGAWLHDWGKANSHFQKMLRDPTFRQGIRHETVSLLLSMEFEEWLGVYWEGKPSWVRCATLFSASGHHLKFPDPYRDERTGTEVTILTGHKDFSAVLELERASLGLQPIPDLANIKLSLLKSGKISKRLNSLQRQLDHEFNDREKILIAAAKSVLMAADLAGSALPSKVENPEEWIADRLIRSLKSSELKDIADRRLRGKTPHQFQKEIGDTHSRTTLVEAGCGSGKTAAAYLWASRHADGKRLFFCYPTTGTASEGFGGYLADPDFDAILIHSRSQVDYRLLENLPNPSHEESDLRAARLEAMETWPIPAVVCTAHTVLGLFENVRRGLYAFPSLMQSVFIFDEIHAFSERMFSYLLRFLKTFSGTPILLMTATLPPQRKQALEKVVQSRGGLQIVKGPRQRESSKRYLLETASLEQIWSEVLDCVSSKGKVLWVSNTVRRVMQNLDKAKSLGLPVEPYHSRYRYKDRLSRHRSVVDGFFLADKPLLALTTQVAEMSLDLSADLLIAEYAPVPSLIQRLGRLNRYEETPAKIGKALFIEPESILPYSGESMEGVEAWLHAVGDGEPKSQLELAEAFLTLDSGCQISVEPVAHCEWLDGLWQSRRDQRAIEEAGYIIEIIREEDLGAGSNVEFAIPMPIPKNTDWKTWNRSGRYLIAPHGSIHYDSFRGAEWE